MDGLGRTRSEGAAHFLADASDVLARSFDLSWSLPRVAGLAAAWFRTICVIETAVNGTALVFALGGVDGDDKAKRALGAVRARLEAGEALEDLDDAVWVGAGVEPLAVQPILAGRDRIGAIALVRPSTASVPQGVDPGFVAEVATRLAAAIDNAHRFMRERRVSRSFQQALLPTDLPSGDQHAFYAAYAPASDEAEVGGDWYDAFVLPDGRIALSIGDVAGHGLEAAVVMGEVRQTFRVAAMENRDPAGVLDMANRLLMLRRDATMVTALFGVFDGRTFTYSSAGHPPPALGTIEGTSEQLPIAGIPLGVETDPSRQSWTVSVPPGSLLVLYTDGLIELGRDVLDGERRLLDAVAAEARRPSKDPAASIRDRVLGRRANVDDIAILALAVAEAPAEKVDLQFTAMPVASRLVRQSVSRFAKAAGLADDQRFALNVAIGEAVNNVIEHSYLREPGTFSVRVVRDSCKIVSTVEDKGVWRRARRDGRGHGLSIIRSLMDGVEVNMSRAGTTVRMVYDVDGRVSAGGAPAR